MIFFGRFPSTGSGNVGFLVWYDNHYVVKRCRIKFGMTVFFRGGIFFALSCPSVKSEWMVVQTLNQVQGDGSFFDMTISILQKVPFDGLRERGLSCLV